MTSRTQELDDMAWECRALANAATDDAVREQLLEIAEQFERLARYRQHSEIRTLGHSNPDGTSPHRRPHAQGR